MNQASEEKIEVTKADEPEVEVDVKKGYRRNVIVVNIARVLLGWLLLLVKGAKVKHYKPKNKPFVLISNHSDPLDPGFEMIALRRYIRYVASDHLIRTKVGGWIITRLGGVIVKHREKPSEYLTEEILKNLRAGISVGIHAEGGTSNNGETGYISEHTGKLVKDSGAGLITFRFTGGYLRTPRWADNSRKGPLLGEVVNEYSPDELKDMSVSEITEIIKRDTFVNVYEEQKKEAHDYVGEKLAERVERTLYVCPVCQKVGDIHSNDDMLQCSCGYKVQFGKDGFFHDTGSGIVYDNICEWDKWQKTVWKDKVLSIEPGNIIFEEKGQIVASVHGNKKNVISENATIRLYPDSFWIVLGGNKGTITMTFDKMKQVQMASKEALILIDDNNYLDIRSHVPRSASKYVAAWRYLTGKEYY